MTSKATKKNAWMRKRAKSNKILVYLRSFLKFINFLRVINSLVV